MSAYTRRLLGHSAGIPEEMQARLHRDTAGNPFYIEEYLRLLGEMGGFERRGATWTLKAGIQTPIPRSLEDAARRRLESLSGLRKQVIEAAAVLARPFTSKELYSLIAFDNDTGEAGDPDTIRPALDGVVLDQLLKREGSHFAFAHAALEQASYASLEKEERCRLHTVAAGWLQQEHSGTGEPPLEELARHLFFSDHPESSRDLLESLSLIHI